MISERDRCYVAASYQFDPHVELAFERAEKADGVQLMAPYIPDAMVSIFGGQRS